MKIAVKMDPIDNVAVVMQDVDAGDQVSIGKEMIITAVDKMNRGHKIAVARILTGEYITKYGVSIGKAASDIEQGMHVHTHNVLDITREVNGYSIDGGRNL